ncbi:MAG TPA: hypothetical protein V6C85_33265 [Allocoleopsis sp.]
MVESPFLWEPKAGAGLWTVEALAFDIYNHYSNNSINAINGINSISVTKHR